jgi:two-component system KDP operon response regulator KdpE
MKKVLIIEDDDDCRDRINLLLIFQNHIPLQASNGLDGLSLVQNQKPDLVLLDIGLPDIDGLELLDKIRTFSMVPIVIITANHDKNVIKYAFNHFADDYITKPFTITELEARIFNALNHKRVNYSETIFQGYDFVVDYNTFEIQVKDKKFQLSKTEYLLLKLLIDNIGNVLSNQFILESVWNRSLDESTELIRTYILKLRHKIEPDPKNPKYIVSLPGIGYRLETICCK